MSDLTMTNAKMAAMLKAIERITKPLRSLEKQLGRINRLLNIQQKIAKRLALLTSIQKMLPPLAKVSSMLDVLNKKSQQLNQNLTTIPKTLSFVFGEMNNVINLLKLFVMKLSFSSDISVSMSQTVSIAVANPAVCCGSSSNPVSPTAPATPANATTSISPEKLEEWFLKLLDTIEKVKKAVKSLVDILEALAKIGPLIRTIYGEIILLLAWIKRTSIILGQFLLRIGQVIGARLAHWARIAARAIMSLGSVLGRFLLVAGRLALLSAPFVLLGIAIYMIYQEWDAFVWFFKEGIFQLGADIYEWIGLIPGIGPVLQSILSIAGTVFGGIMDGIFWVIQLFTDWDTAIAVLMMVWENFKTTLSMIWIAIQNACSAAFDYIKTAITNVVNGLTFLWDGYKTALSAIWSAIQTACTAAFDLIKTTVTAVADGLGIIWEGFKTALGTIWATIQTAGEAAFNFIANTVNSVVDGATIKWEAFKNTLSTIWENIKTAAAAPLAWVEEKLSWISGLWDRLTGKKAPPMPPNNGVELNEVQDDYEVKTGGKRAVGPIVPPVCTQTDGNTSNAPPLTPVVNTQNTHNCQCQVTNNITINATTKEHNPNEIAQIVLQTITRANLFPTTHGKSCLGDAT